MATSKIGRRGTVVIPAELRRRFGLTEGSLIIAEATEAGVLIRPAVAVPADTQWRHRLLEQANRDYAESRDDPEGWQATLVEREAWDATLLDGLEPDEVWTEDGAVEPRAGEP